MPNRSDSSEKSSGVKKSGRESFVASNGHVWKMPLLIRENSVRARLD
jgi:hypothetical protein